MFSFTLLARCHPTACVLAGCGALPTRRFSLVGFLFSELCVLAAYQTSDPCMVLSERAPYIFKLHGEQPLASAQFKQQKARKG